MNLKELRKMTETIRDKYQKATCVSLEIWCHRPNGNVHHDWQVSIVGDAVELHTFQSLAELMDWLQPPDDDIDFSADELHADVSPTIGDMAHALDSGAI